MKTFLLALCAGLANLLPAQQFFSGVFQTTEDSLIYADNISENALEGKVREWKEIGFRPIELESKLIDDQRYYWLIGSKSDLKCELKKISGWAEFVKIKRAMIRSGFVLTDVEAYAISESDFDFVAIWHEGNTGYNIWKLQSAESLKMITEEMDNRNFYPANVKVFQTPAKVDIFLACFYHGPASSKTYISITRDERSFQEDLLQRTKSGYRLIKYESYPSGEMTMSLAIYRRGDSQQRFISNLNKPDFNGLWKEQEMEGLKLVNVNIR